mgnify:CR=1
MRQFYLTYPKFQSVTGKLTWTSKPRNPLIANVCIKGDLIDAWGRWDS